MFNPRRTADILKFDVTADTRQLSQQQIHRLDDDILRDDPRLKVAVVNSLVALGEAITQSAQETLPEIKGAELEPLEETLLWQVVDYLIGQPVDRYSALHVFQHRRVHDLRRQKVRVRLKLPSGQRRDRAT